MSIRIQDNHMALQSQRHLSTSQTEMGRTTERLSTGYRINRAGDDAAGLHISTNLQAQIRGIRKAIDNTQDALNMISIMDSTYQSLSSMVHRVRELSVQAANDTYGTVERANIQAEVNQLIEESNNIADSATYNSITLFKTPGVDSGFYAQNGNDRLAIYIQVGPDSSDVLNIDEGNINGLDFVLNRIGNLDVSTRDDALAALTSIDDDIFRVINARRNEVGAISNNLGNVINNLQVELENVSQANSRLQDADVATESLNLIQSQIKQNSAAAMLTQANGQNAQIALGLIGA